MENFFTFKKKIGSTLVKIMYFLGVFSIFFYSIFLIIPNINKNHSENTILYGISLLIMGNILWRIICELFIIIFSIHENIAEINKKLISNNNSYETIKNTINIENSSKTWACPKCNVVNPNTTYECKNCGYKLI